MHSGRVVIRVALHRIRDTHSCNVRS
jgi:hypothetical protein